MKAEKEVMERLEVISKGKEEEEDNPVEDEDPTIWLFHGTTAEDVQKVFESTSLQGKINRDFNIEGSFYLTSSFAWAAQTAGLRSRSASSKGDRKDGSKKHEGEYSDREVPRYHPVVAFEMKKSLVNEKIFSLAPDPLEEATHSRTFNNDFAHCRQHILQWYRT